MVPERSSLSQRVPIGGSTLHLYPASSKASVPLDVIPSSHTVVLCL